MSEDLLQGQLIIDFSGKVLEVSFISITLEQWLF